MKRVHFVVSSLLVIGMFCGGCFAGSASPTKLPLTGSFLQLDETNLGWPESKWRTELKTMAQMGMDTQIIQACVSETDGAFYASDRFKQWKGFGTKDPVGTLFELSEPLGIKIYLGLNDYDIWQENGVWAEHLRKMIDKSKPVADELAQRYAKRKAFAGWYITQEFYDWTDPEAKLFDAYRELSDYCHQITPGKPVLYAPYFTKDSLNEEACRKGWNELLPKIRADIIALQDGVGCDRGLTPENIIPAYRTVSKVCREHHVQFWSDLEIFDTVADDWKPTAATRVLAQAKAVSPYVQKIVVYDYNHQMSTLRGQDEQKLYQDYLKLFADVLKKKNYHNKRDTIN